MSKSKCLIVLATTDNPDAPEDEAFASCPDSITENDWDESSAVVVGGSWYL